MASDKADDTSKVAEDGDVSKSEKNEALAAIVALHEQLQGMSVDQVHDLFRPVFSDKSDLEGYELWRHMGDKLVEECARDLVAFYARCDGRNKARLCALVAAATDEASVQIEFEGLFAVLCNFCGMVAARLFPDRWRAIMALWDAAQLHGLPRTLTFLLSLSPDDRAVVMASGAMRD